MTIVLSIITVVLLSISVWQIVKIFEVSNLGKKRDNSQVANYKDNDLHGKLMFAFLVFIYLVTIFSFVSYTKVLLPEAASEHGSTYDTLFFISLSQISLAEATTLFFVSPFFITIFSYFILKIQIGINRLFAVCVGFFGVILIIKPEFNNININDDKLEVGASTIDINL